MIIKLDIPILNSKTTFKLILQIIILNVLITFKILTKIIFILRNKKVIQSKITFKLVSVKIKLDILDILSSLMKKRIMDLLVNFYLFKVKDDDFSDVFVHFDDL